MSTNVLIDLPLVTGRLDLAAERESLFEKGGRSPMFCFVVSGTAIQDLAHVLIRAARGLRHCAAPYETIGSANQGGVLRLRRSARSSV